jgi:serine protease Do
VPETQNGRKLNDMNRTTTPLLNLRAAALLGLTALTILPLEARSKPSQAAAGTNPPARLNVDESPLRREVKAATSFAPVIKKVAPSVVNIYSTMTVRERALPFFNDPMWRRFFGEESGDQSRPRTHREQGLGSGVIITPDGYILTANHVVEGAEKVKVALATGGKEFDAKVIGTDPATDTAVLKVDGKDLPAITIADSDKLEVGDVVLAVGNPFAVGQTVTMGIVSGLARGGFGINNYENFIQTDAAINPGNSGGALVDAEGRLVGINTAIFSHSGGNQGVGFAVPLNMARYALDRLIKEGKVTRGYLGLSLQPEVTLELVKQFGLPDMNGALVTSVQPDSPASKAGAKDGDFVIEFNGQKVADMRHLRLLVSQTAPGTKVTLKVLRDGKEKTLMLTLGTMPEEITAQGSRAQPTQHSNSEMDALDGVEVTDLSELDARARRQNDIPRNIEGAIVTSVQPESNSAEAGLKVGDVIVAINRESVHSANEAVALSDKAKGDQILLRVWRANTGGGGGGMLYLSVDNVKHK